MAVHLDRLTTLEMTERPGDATGGQIVEMVREARVSGILDSKSEGYTDYQILQQALDDLNLDLLSAAVGHPNLILVERTPRLVAGEVDVVDVQLRYEQRGMTLDSVAQGTFLFEGTTRLRQVTSQKDRVGNPLTVSYTYPASFPIDPGLENATVSQVGEIQVGMPNDTIELVGRFQAEKPWLETRLRVGKINEFGWEDGEPGTWLCASSAYNPYVWSEVKNQRVFEFRYTLQYDPLGHNPDVWYRDPRTGRMPVGLGVAGLYEVQWYDPASFIDLFPLV